MCVFTGVIGEYNGEEATQEYSPSSQPAEGAELSPHSRAATPLECMQYGPTGGDYQRATILHDTSEYIDAFGRRMDDVIYNSNLKLYSTTHTPSLYLLLN